MIVTYASYISVYVTRWQPKCSQGYQSASLEDPIQVTEHPPTGDHMHDMIK